MSGSQVPVLYVPNSGTGNDLRFPAIMGAPDKAGISRWLLAARTGRGITQRAVSVALDVTEKTVARWEDEEAPPLPPADQFLHLVWLYGADLSALLPRKPLPVDVEGGIDMPRPTRSGAASEGKKKRPA